MLGNEAVARGLWEAGVRFVSSYPGTPSTEITEYAAKYEEIYAEWAPNEKVAVESAIGASFAGARAFSAMKHVGLNVAADPVFTAAYTGVNAGLVLAVADDPDMHSSQNEQDSRHYALAAKLPMLEPSDSAECLQFIKDAYELSERFDTPVMLRLTTRIAHARSLVPCGNRADIELKAYTKNAAKYVMVPAAARTRHVVVEERLRALSDFAETAPPNTVLWSEKRVDGKKVGVIAAGIAYASAREALGDQVSYLKLGFIHPLPRKLILDFASQVDELFVIEELDPFIETSLRAWGLKVRGKSDFSLLGEIKVATIRNVVLGADTAAPKKEENFTTAPQRPPVLCPGCPHRGLFHILSKLKLTVTGDIGCYTLAAAPPLSAMDLCVCMGASVSSLHGFVTARPEMASKTLAVIGDSTFAHSGITGLVDIVYNQSPATVLILDNSITGMTGHQQNPCSGRTLKGAPAPALDLVALCRAVGVSRVVEVDPHDLAEVEARIKEELAAPEPSVIVTRRPCILLPNVPKQDAYRIDSERCTACKACMRIGCPAIRLEGQKNLSIDASLCVGCGLCERLCRFGAIGRDEQGLSFERESGAVPSGRESAGAKAAEPKGGEPQ